MEKWCVDVTHFWHPKELSLNSVFARAFGGVLVYSCTCSLLAWVLFMWPKCLTQIICSQQMSVSKWPIHIDYEIGFSLRNVQMLEKMRPFEHQESIAQWPTKGQECWTGVSWVESSHSYLESEWEGWVFLRDTWSDMVLSLTLPPDTLYWWQ